MNGLPEVLNIAQYGLAVIFIWLFWQERQAHQTCWKERVAELVRHNDALMTLLVFDENSLTLPQGALRRRVQSFNQWSQANPPDVPPK